MNRGEVRQFTVSAHPSPWQGQDDRGRLFAQGLLGAARGWEVLAVSSPVPNTDRRIHPLRPQQRPHRRPSCGSPSQFPASSVPLWLAPQSASGPFQPGSLLIHRAGLGIPSGAPFLAFHGFWQVFLVIGFKYILISGVTSIPEWRRSLLGGLLVQ